MTKTELAESMAIFLGWNYSAADSYVGQDLWVSPDGKDDVECWGPAGFLAVWDKVECTWDDEVFKSIWNRFNELYWEYKKPKYTAFYSAVHEMRMKE